MAKLWQQTIIGASRTYTIAGRSITLYPSSGSGLTGSVRDITTYNSVRNVITTDAATIPPNPDEYYLSAILQGIASAWISDNLGSIGTTLLNAHRGTIGEVSSWLTPGHTISNVLISQDHAHDVINTLTWDDGRNVLSSSLEIEASYRTGSTADFTSNSQQILTGFASTNHGSHVPPIDSGDVGRVLTATGNSPDTFDWANVGTGTTTVNISGGGGTTNTDTYQQYDFRLSGNNVQARSRFVNALDGTATTPWSNWLTEFTIPSGGSSGGGSSTTEEFNPRLLGLTIGRDPALNTIYAIHVTYDGTARGRSAVLPNTTISGRTTTSGRYIEFRGELVVSADGVGTHTAGPFINVPSNGHLKQQGTLGVYDTFFVTLRPNQPNPNVPIDDARPAYVGLTTSVVHGNELHDPDFATISNVRDRVNNHANLPNVHHTPPTVPSLSGYVTTSVFNTHVTAFNRHTGNASAHHTKTPEVTNTDTIREYAYRVDSGNLQFRSRIRNVVAGTNGSWTNWTTITAVSSVQADTDTTYDLTIDGTTITLTGSDGTEDDVEIPAVVDLSTLTLSKNSIGVIELKDGDVSHGAVRLEHNDLLGIEHTQHQR